MASANVVTVSIQSDFNEFPAEKRYDPNINILELKKKLELITGAIHTSMIVTLYKDDKEIGTLANNNETLAHYLGEASQSGSVLKLVVKDQQPSLIPKEGDVPKFVLGEEEYSKRSDTARNFIKELRQK